jgi:hypothetical protein
VPPPLLLLRSAFLISFIFFFFYMFFFFFFFKGGAHPQAGNKRGKRKGRRSNAGNVDGSGNAGNGAFAVPVTTIHEFTPVEYASYDVRTRLVVPTANGTLLPKTCGYRFVGKGCVRLPDTLHIRHYRRHHSRKKIEHQSADSADRAEFQRAVLAPARDEICRRIKKSRLVGRDYVC